MTNDECRFRFLIVYIKNGAKNTSKIWRQIFLANANLNGQSIATNQGQAVNISIPHPHKIILNIVQDFIDRDIN